MSQHEFPYPTVLVVDKPKPEGRLQQLGKTCGAISAVIGVGAVLLSVGRWSQSVEDQAHARAPASTLSPTESSSAPAAPNETHEQQRAASATPTGGLAVAIHTPKPGTTVGREFQLSGTFKGSLRRGEVLAAFVRHGTSYWGKGQIDVDSQSGQFEHLVHEGGRVGLFSVLVAAIPARIYADVERDIRASHATRQYRAWQVSDLGGVQFRPLTELELHLLSRGKGKEQ